MPSPFKACCPGWEIADVAEFDEPGSRRAQVQDAQEEKIRNLQERIAALETLEERIAALETGRAKKKPRISSRTKWGQAQRMEEASQEPVEEEEEEALPELVYEINRSMWDVAILLAFNVPRSQKFAIIFGLLLNLSMQILLIVVIKENMLQPDFTAETVEQMLKWRTDLGHSSYRLDQHTGETFLQKLCDQNLWGFEQESYSAMFDYLHHNIPGYSLSFLATVLWVLVSLVEFRATIAQAISIFSLPRLRWDDNAHEIDDQIQGISTLMRAVCTLFCTLPRAIILVLLAVTGCQYLAQTISLADIVLNSVALAFVLETDELLAEVLLSRETLDLVDGLEPIKTKMSKGRFCLPAALRFAFAILLLLGSYFVYLQPFHQTVASASMALCGGQLDFTFKGGTPESPQVVLLNNRNWVASCDQKLRETYMQQTYPSSNTSTPDRQEDDTNWGDKRMMAVFKQAFSGCPKGQILKLGKCANIPTILKGLLPDEIFSNPPKKCKRFDPSLGAATCAAESPQPDACLDDWFSEACDGTSPGNIHHEACGHDVYKSCVEWENVFHTSHPTQHCKTIFFCQGSEEGYEPPYDCLAAIGQLKLQVSNSSAFEADQTATEDAVAIGLATALNIPKALVHILQVRGWPAKPTPALRDVLSRRLQSSELPLQLYNSPGPVVIGGTALVTYIIQTLPTRVMPEKVPSLGVALTAAINQFHPVNGSVVAASEFANWPWMYYEPKRLFGSLLAMSRRGPKQITAARAAENAAWPHGA